MFKSLKHTCWLFMSILLAVSLLFSCSDDDGGPTEPDGNGNGGGPTYGWSAMVSPTTDGIFGIWGVADSSVHAVGDNGTVLYYDGSSWTDVAYAGKPAIRLRRVWGASADTVFAVGDDRHILQYDGSSWSVSQFPTSAEVPVDASFRDVWGTSGSDVYIVGTPGVTLHYNGSAWSELPNPVGVTGLNGVWGAGGFVLACGDGGMFLRKTPGDDWTILNPTFTIRLMRAVSGTSVGDVFYVGEYRGSAPEHDRHTAIHLKITPPSGYEFVNMGSTLSMLGSPLPNRDFNDVWGHTPGKAFVVGSNGSIIELTYQAVMVYDWSLMDSPTTRHLRGIWGFSSTNAFAVGDYGTIIRYQEVP